MLIHLMIYKVCQYAVLHYRGWCCFILYEACLMLFILVVLTNTLNLFSLTVIWMYAILIVLHNVLHNVLQSRVYER